jgi:maleate isomerase
LDRGGFGDVKIGLLLPSTNTVAETEYWEMLPWGVTAHAGRMLVTQTEVGTDRDYLYLNDQMFTALEPTLANLLTCRPDHLALAMSAMSFVGGAAADPALRQRLEESSGVPVTSGPSACLAAVRAVGASRIGLLSPFQPAVEAETARWFTEHDIEVVSTFSFLAQTTLGIAAIGPDDVRAALVALDDERVEAFVQVGTNVRMAGLAAGAEWWLGKPVIHVNTAMVWDILRAHDMAQKIGGFGVLLEQH